MSSGLDDLLRPGWHRCCICFTVLREHQLFLDPVDGKRWDVCAVGKCAEHAGLPRQTRDSAAPTALAQGGRGGAIGSNDLRQRARVLRDRDDARVREDANAERGQDGHGDGDELGGREPVVGHGGDDGLADRPDDGG